MALTERERLQKILRKEPADRPPVIIPGGMMSFLTAEVLFRHHIDGSRINDDAATMVAAAAVSREETGMENLGVPFCLTCEAEALGADISRGTTDLEPMVMAPVLADAGQIDALAIPAVDGDRRLSATVSAIAGLKKRFPGVPVIGNITGPMTLASSIIEFETYARMIIKDPPLARRVLNTALEMILAFTAAMLGAGADIITVGDPTASGDILGSSNFSFLMPAYRRIFKLISDSNARSILHICGNITSIFPFIRETGADALSMDSMISPRAAREALGNLPLVGNVSTQLLAEGRPADVGRGVERLLRDGIDIIAPSCGLDRGTALANIRAMTAAAKGTIT